jgi:4-amino-4-deoxy-L-arabinose transferase-like glycosyltransferase
MFASSNMTRFVVIAILLCAVLWFGTLGQRDLFDPDEGRYAGIPAAMVDSGDWLTPRLNEFKYFEKPVLQYWGTAVAFNGI